MADKKKTRRRRVKEPEAAQNPFITLVQDEIGDLVRDPLALAENAELGRANAARSEFDDSRRIMAALEQFLSTSSAPSAPPAADIDSESV